MHFFSIFCYKKQPVVVVKIKFKVNQMIIFEKENKYFKYAFFILLILISLVFFLINHSYFKQHDKAKSLNEFQVETKNIHSIFIQQFKNQHLKKKFIYKKRAKFKFNIIERRNKTKGYT